MLESALEKQKQLGLYRKRFLSEELSFCSNDYLDLSSHPNVLYALKKSAQKYGVGSCASSLLGGYSKAHQALEEELAAFLGYERALLFSSGYMANLGVCTALIKKTDHVYTHRANHASLIDGVKYSTSKYKRYTSLPTNLEKNAFVISDGVFSMDGSIAPLVALENMTKNNNSILIIDDSHGLGVLGKKGGGSSELLSIKPSILTSSFGKAFGTSGAVVAGSTNTIENIIQFSRTYRYTTALSPAMADATRSSLQLIKAGEWRREYLQTLIAQFKKIAAELNIELLPSSTPIQTILIGSNERVINVFNKLNDSGISVGAIRPPTVPKNQSRLRISLTVKHTEQQIVFLLEKLHFLLKNESL